MYNPQVLANSILPIDERLENYMVALHEHFTDRSLAIKVKCKLTRQQYCDLRHLLAFTYNPDVDLRDGVIGMYEPTVMFEDDGLTVPALSTMHQLYKEQAELLEFLGINVSATTESVSCNPQALVEAAIQRRLTEGTMPEKGMMQLKGDALQAFHGIKQTVLGVSLNDWLCRNAQSPGNFNVTNLWQGDDGYQDVKNHGASMLEWFNNADRILNIEMEKWVGGDLMFLNAQAGLVRSCTCTRTHTC